MDSEIMRQVAEAFETLDLTAENARIAELETERAEIKSAISRTEERYFKLAGALQAGGVPDGVAVADALLLDSDVQDAAEAGPGRAAMEAERDSLREGLRELRRRLDKIQPTINLAKDEAKMSAAEAAGPLIDALMAEARHAVAALPALYAAVYAVQTVTGAGTHDLRHLREALRAILGGDGLLPYLPPQSVPSDVLGALQRLVGKGAALRPRIVQTVPMP